MKNHGAEIFSEALPEGVGSLFQGVVRLFQEQRGYFRRRLDHFQLAEHFSGLSELLQVVAAIGATLQMRLKGALLSGL
jgi:hypothetical protein